MTSPCFGCTERKTLCHSTCEKYIEYTSKIKREFSEAKAVASGYFAEQKRKVKRRMRNKKGGL